MSGGPNPAVGNTQGSPVTAPVAKGRVTVQDAAVQFLHKGRAVQALSPISMELAPAISRSEVLFLLTMYGRCRCRLRKQTLSRFRMYR